MRHGWTRFIFVTSCSLVFRLRDVCGACDDVTDQGGNFAADVAEMGGHAELAAWLRTECSGARARSLAALGLTEPADSELIG